MLPRQVADRRQKNSVFLTREQSNKRSGARLKTESETGAYGRVRPACFVRVRPLSYAKPILRKKTRLFCSLLGEFVLGSPRVQIVDHALGFLTLLF